MKKFELHWQILIALVLGVLYGVVFAPSYLFDNESFKQIDGKHIEKELIEKLETLKDKELLGKSEITSMISTYYAKKLKSDEKYVKDGKEWSISKKFVTQLESIDVPDLLKDQITESSLKTFESKEKVEKAISLHVTDLSTNLAETVFANSIIKQFQGKKIYILTEESFEIIKQKNIPENFSQRISSLKGKEFDTKEELNEKVKTILRKDYALYQSSVKAEIKEINYIVYVKWLGDLFMRGLRMVIIPLILSSIIAGVANIGNAENLGRLGLKTMGYYVITSTLAIVTGLAFVNIIEPGLGADLGFSKSVEGLEVAKESFGDTLMNIVPTNVFYALSFGQTLSVIFFAILVGFFITRINKKSSIFLTDFFNATFDVMMKITMFVILFTPLGIFGIVASVVSEQPNLANLAARLGWYMIAVLGGLLVHAFFTLPMMLKFIGKANPWLHFKIMRSALLTAFSTSSSGATLSLTMESVEHKAGVSTKITSFTLPLGATINMDGTALYECVAAMFIAQAYGIELSFMDQIIVVITALLASIGAASIPMAGLVMITVVLSAIGLPLEGVGLILAVDRVLDMFRTATNVWSDSCGAVIIAKSEGETLNV